MLERLSVLTSPRMQQWDRYREVQLQRGKLVAQIAGYQQSDWVAACRRLGLPVSTSHGNGSHAVVFKHDCSPEDRACCITTLTTHMHKNIQRDIFKKVLSYGNESGLYGEDDVWEAL